MKKYIDKLNALDLQEVCFLLAEQLIQDEKILFSPNEGFRWKESGENVLSIKQNAWVTKQKGKADFYSS